MSRSFPSAFHLYQAALTGNPFLGSVSKDLVFTRQTVMIAPLKFTKHEVDSQVFLPPGKPHRRGPIYLSFTMIPAQSRRQKAHGANCSAKCKFCTGNTSPGRKQSGCQGELFLKGPNAPARQRFIKNINDKALGGKGLFYLTAYHPSPRESGQDQGRNLEGGTEVEAKCPSLHPHGLLRFLSNTT